MKKIKLITLFIGLFLFSIMSVNAASITSTSFKDNKFTVSGTGTGEVQIVLFNESKEPVFLTTATATDGKFSKTLPVIDSTKTGTYTFKVADYDGTNTALKEIKVSVDSSNPKTFDNIISSTIIFIISIIGIGFGSIFIKKRMN